VGDLASFPKNQENRELINAAIKEYSVQDKNTAIIYTDQLKDKGDSLHFNSKGQRALGKRFAREMIGK